MSGRPFRFLATAMGGWVVVRVGLLWPTIETLPDLIRAIVPPVAAAEPTAFYAEAPARAVAVVRERRAPARVAEARRPSLPVAAPPATVADTTPVEPAPPRLAQIARAPQQSRLAVSLWGIARQGAGGSRFGSQLGGSQAGVRATYRIGRGLALAARASGGLDGSGKELALGLDWQPLAAPVHLVAERRIAVGPGAGGTAVFVVAGLDPRPVAAGFRLEAYAQAGAVIRRGSEPFADGAARLMRTVADRRGTRIALGAGL